MVVIMVVIEASAHHRARDRSTVMNQSFLSSRIASEARTPDATRTASGAPSKSPGHARALHVPYMTHAGLMTYVGNHGVPRLRRRDSPRRSHAIAEILGGGGAMASGARTRACRAVAAPCAS